MVAEVCGNRGIDHALLLTADQRFWPAATKRTYLGRWCTNNPKETILPYVYDEQGLLLESYAYLQGLYLRLLPKLVTTMNAMHGQQENQRYWGLVIGYWLREYIEVLYERYLTILRARDMCPDADVSLLSAQQYTTPIDSRIFDSLLVSDLYNQQLYSQLVELLGCFKKTYITIGAEQAASAMPLNKIPSITFKKQAIKWLSMQASRFNRYYIASTYLPVKTLLGVSLRLGIFPSIDTPHPNFKGQALDQNKRQLFSQLKTEDAFEAIVCQTLAVNFPQMYIENFSQLHAFVNSHFPRKRVKLIMTANAFSVNDGFKLWTAKQISQYSVPFAIVQHGGNYGCAEWNSSEDYEVMMADYYLTYGWSDKSKTNVMPFIPNRIAYREPKKAKQAEKQGILWVLASLPRFSYTMYSVPVGPQFQTYLDEQVRFLNNLNQDAKAMIQCRPYSYEYGWNDVEEIKKQSYDFQVVDTRQSIQQQMRQARLYVCTYNATAHLEALAANIPTIMYWNPLHWRLRPSAMACHELLKQAGILHDTPESAATQLSMVYRDPEAWWLSDRVQAARAAFCQQFANVMPSPASLWANKMRELAT